jgi:D-arabinose 1-dehydrogenase-like Zn-dependent alcohol dehydrogenase
MEARARLLYGEWLRRENRRSQARSELRSAHEAFTSMGAEAFAERAGRELAATGETVRKRTLGVPDQLTSQESQIVRQAMAGRSNPEIAAALFLSSGLTAWQALLDHAHLRTGQTVLIHGVGGAVGSIAAQLAREAGAHIIGTGRASDKDVASDLGVHTFVDLDRERLEDAGEVDVVLDVIGGDIRNRSTALVRPGGTLVTIAGPPTIHPRDGRAIFFVVEPNRDQLAQLATRLHTGRLVPLIDTVRPLSDAPAAFAPAGRTRGRTIIKVTTD